MIKIHYGWLFSLLFFIALLCCSCGTTKSNTDDSVSAPPGYVPGQTSVLAPTADGTVQTGDEPLILDFSNASMGYFMGESDKRQYKSKYSSDRRGRCGL